MWYLCVVHKIVCIAVAHIVFVCVRERERLTGGKVFANGAIQLTPNTVQEMVCGRGGVTLEERYHYIIISSSL